MSKVTIVNLDSLYKKLDKLKLSSIESGVEKACLMVERDARNNCPVDTGELRNSIKSEVHTEGTKVIGEVGSNLDYAVYVHEGTGLFAANGDGRKDVPWMYKTADGEWHITSGIHPQPFLQNALDSNRTKITETIMNAVKEQIHNV